MQFLKFQAFAEQLTKETQDLKIKIENHKREARRLTSLIEQQKDDAARLTVRLSGTEKQRDDALEALVLQQEIAEELERERKRNKKELSALQHTNATILRQRDEAQRVVIHLRALISGQAHHMEHIVQTLGQKNSIQDFVEQGYPSDEPGASEDLEDIAEEGPSKTLSPRASRPTSRLGKRASLNSNGEVEASAEMEAALYRTNPRNSRRFSGLSIIDVADRQLRDKTNDIADIIRNISAQCAAAVEGLQLAHDAEVEAEEFAHNSQRASNLSVATSEDGRGSETGDDAHLSPVGRHSSIPPTPDLVHNRSSTAMSIASTITTPDRSSLQYIASRETTKIVEDDDEEITGRSDNDLPVQNEGTVTNLTGKIGTDERASLIHRPAGARISALGGGGH